MVTTGSAGAHGDLAALQQFLARVTYKPGWSFSAYATVGTFREYLILRITYLTPDAHDTSRTGRVTHTAPLPPLATTDDRLHRWLFDQIMAAERHEAAEFFRVDGAAVYDPHRSDRERRS